MFNFISGVVFMYVLAMPLFLHITEPADDEDTSAPMRFALLWPLACLEVLYRTLKGDYKDDDGTSSN